MATLPVETDLLERLLDPADPALRVRVLTDLLDRPDDDPEVVRARERVPEQPWMRATLAAHHGDGTWGRSFYAKYDGTSWVLLHLSEVGVPRDETVERGLQRLALKRFGALAWADGAAALPRPNATAS